MRVVKKVAHLAEQLAESKARKKVVQSAELMAEPWAAKWAALTGWTLVVLTAVQMVGLLVA